MTYFAITLSELRGMGACYQWSHRWEDKFGGEAVDLTPEMVATLLDEGFPIEWFVTEANYYTAVIDDREAARAIALALLDDARAAVAEHMPDQVGDWDAARAAVAALDLTDFSATFWNLVPEPELTHTQANLAKEWLVFAPLTACNQVADLCGVVEKVRDMVSFSSELIGGAKGLPKTCAAIARFGVDHYDAIQRRVDEMNEPDEEDEDPYSYEDDDEEDEEEGDAVGEDIDQSPA